MNWEEENAGAAFLKIGIIYIFLKEKSFLG